MFHPPPPPHFECIPERGAGWPCSRCVPVVQGGGGWGVRVSIKATRVSRLVLPDVHTGLKLKKSMVHVACSRPPPKSVFNSVRVGQSSLCSWRPSRAGAACLTQSGSQSGAGSEGAPRL